VASLTYVSSELFDHTLNITMSIKISHWFFDHCLNPSRLHLVSKSILSKRFGTYFFTDSRPFNEMYLFSVANLSAVTVILPWLISC